MQLVLLFVFERERERERETGVMTWNTIGLVYVCNVCMCVHERERDR